MSKKLKLAPMLTALLAALLFGASAPFSKLLLGDIQPLPLASLLYLGCGLGVLLFKLVQLPFRKSIQKEAPLVKKDIPWLIGIVLTGGVAAPVILMYSLQATPASTASLLLNFEAVATALIAALLFREALGKRIWIAIALITAACIILTWSNAGKWGFSPGMLGIICACLLWGMDNNLTRAVSSKDPLIITIIKGFGAGLVSLMLTFITGGSFPSLLNMGYALLLGAASYGISIVLFILSMRSMGAARTSAFFGTAPFIGALISVLLFGEAPALQFYLSLPLLMIGAVLILGEKHGHLHMHTSLQHDHMHTHDDYHHGHAHPDGFSGQHAHPHCHENIEHAHPHLPDIHHRHIHKHR
jgi:drug/metabolite transporter (DMT)-like permease